MSDQAPGVIQVRPSQLEDLAGVFDQMEAGGTNVALLPALGDRAVPRLEEAALPEEPSGWLAVTSSGSTGVPKVVWRRWTDLRVGLSHRPEIRGWCWAAPYAPWTFAGVQVALQAWLVAGRVVSLPHDWTEAWRKLEQTRPDAVSATPTYLDLLLQEEALPAFSDTHQRQQSKEAPKGFPQAAGSSEMSAETAGFRRGWSPRQITLGGEPLRPGVGQRLAARFPTARFTVVYAAAEFGVIATTHRMDGWYELAALDGRFPGGWRQEDGVLELQRGGDWRSTGDLVEVAGDLFRVIGRADGVANVAGTKVNLAQVAAVAEEVPGVLRAVAVAEPNSVTGQVVCLRYAPAPGLDSSKLANALEAHLRAQLPKAAWPRKWVVDQVAPVHNAKRAVG
ncbi:MAG: acyl--CoA ligase [Verrucomicrobia bacterium]|nr:acyl--CoA ligase [Verrucomicrobiota bacterium]